MTVYQQLGAGLRAARKRVKLTQQDLADRMAVSVRTVIRTERGETAPTVYLLTTWMRTCGVHLKIEVVDLSDKRSEPTHGA